MNTKAIIGIVLGIVLVVGAFFLYSSLTGGSSQNTTKLVPAGLAPELNNSNSTSTAFAGKEFLRTLVNMQSLKLDDSVFSDPAYRTLVDMSVELQTQPKGRKNPFAPIGTDNSVAQVQSAFQAVSGTSSPVTRTTK